MQKKAKTRIPTFASASFIISKWLLGVFLIPPQIGGAERVKYWKYINILGGNNSLIVVAGLCQVPEKVQFFVIYKCKPNVSSLLTPDEGGLCGSSHAYPCIIIFGIAVLCCYKIEAKWKGGKVAFHECHQCFEDNSVT